MTSEQPSSARASRHPTLILTELFAFAATQRLHRCAREVVVQAECSHDGPRPRPDRDACADGGDLGAGLVQLHLGRRGVALILREMAERDCECEARDPATAVEVGKGTGEVLLVATRKEAR